MPGLSGFDVLQALRDKFQFGELPVVMVSVASLVMFQPWLGLSIRLGLCGVVPTQAKNQSSSVVKGSSSALIDAERLRRKDNHEPKEHPNGNCCVGYPVILAYLFRMS